MLDEEMEKELVANFEKGNYKAEEWRSFWWEERVNASQEACNLLKRVKHLREYIRRCTQRIGDGEDAHFENIIRLDHQSTTRPV